ncbi:hypothetical protein M8C21_020441, partial [Ambrosia artemisiifolia]
GNPSLGQQNGTFIQPRGNNTSNQTTTFIGIPAVDSLMKSSKYPGLLINHKASNTNIIIDDGIGMTMADLANNLGASTRLGSKDDKGVVTTKHNDDGQNNISESQASGSFPVTKDTYGESLGRATKMTS